MLWWITVIWLSGLLFNFGIALYALARPGEWDRLLSQLYEDNPELRDHPEWYVVNGFLFCLFICSCVWFLWYAYEIWKWVKS